MAKLINGNGNHAIYAAQDADLIASLAGNVTCIANVGNKYAATIEDANTIGLADGVIITKEGRRIQLDAGDVDLFAIPTGSSGVTNYYIIGYKLVQQANSSQVAETFVQKMNSSSATIAEGTLRGGDNEVYVSVYRVTQVGFTIDSIDALLPELLDSAAVKADIVQLNSDLRQAIGNIFGVKYADVEVRDWTSGSEYTLWLPSDVTNSHILNIFSLSLNAQYPVRFYGSPQATDRVQIVFINNETGQAVTGKNNFTVRVAYW